jgi:hypothetical protein
VHRGTVLRRTEAVVKRVQHYVQARLQVASEVNPPSEQTPLALAFSQGALPPLASHRGMGERSYGLIPPGIVTNRERDKVIVTY